MLYNLNLVDILIRVESPFPLLDNDSTKEFYIDKAPNSQFDLNFIYQPVDELPVPKNASYIEGRRVYIGYGSEASTFFSPVPEGIPYAWVSRASLDEGILVCKYVPGKEYLLNYKRNVLILMDLEATLLHFDAIILHASFIRWREKGIIFTAPSGTGKSTQAALWEKYYDAEILNGDRAALRRKDGMWRSYGLPYAGTSDIYRNESAPLTAVVALRQATENRIHRIKGTEAFRYLYPETMIHRWDSNFEKKATSLLLSIMSDIPIFLLE
ncbi:MAG: hypothetical protein IKE18_07415, partial [Oscillospiraceae bacterium]|nr:hypothetical protein [Oscillospiraceae bacterium]